MKIGIDASRAFLKRRTGIEEYSYQVIKHLREVLPSDAVVVLYVRKKLQIGSGRELFVMPKIDFTLPENWRVRGIWAPRFWTQIALSLEMLRHTPDVLFVPAHTVPVIHPARNGIAFCTWDITWLSDILRRIIGTGSTVAGRPKKTVVTIHGLEYEFCPEGYSWWERLYMRASIRYSCRVASTVICVSENTKRDVMKLYRVAEEKIVVISEGYENNFQFPISNFQSNSNEPILKTKKPYLLFIGRLEERKNVVRMVEAFEILKERYHIPHELILVGKPGYGYSRIKEQISNSKYQKEIQERGYVTEKVKWELLKNAEVFLFPTLYEGFGIPVLEAQSVGVPVVTSNISSLPEVAGPPTMPPSDIVLRAGGGAMFVDPMSAESIAEGIYRVISDQGLRSGIIEKATHNVSRYSWVRSAQAIGLLLRA